MSSEGRRILKFFWIALALFLAGQCVEQLFIHLNGVGTPQLCNWDCNWYKSIADSGYDLRPHLEGQLGAANWAFFPLFPLLVSCIYLIFGLSIELALIVASKLFFFTAVFAFILFALEWNPECSPWVAGAVAVFNPYSIYGNAGYAESLFLTLTCLSLTYLKQDRFIMSGVFGAFLTGTRIVGGSIGFSYLVGVMRHGRRSRNRLAILFGLCLIPLGMATYMLFLYFRTGDALAFSHVQIAWNHELGNPLTHLASISPESPADLTAGISICTAFLAMVFLAIKRHYEMLIFSLVATLLPLSTGLPSMPRYIWWQAPVLFGLAAVINRKKWTVWFYMAVSICFSYFIYAAWFQGANWVI